MQYYAINDLMGFVSDIIDSKDDTKQLDKFAKYLKNTFKWAPKSKMNYKAKPKCSVVLFERNASIRKSADYNKADLFTMMVILLINCAEYVNHVYVVGASNGDVKQFSKMISSGDFKWNVFDHIKRISGLDTTLSRNSIEQNESSEFIVRIKDHRQIWKVTTEHSADYKDILCNPIISNDYIKSLRNDDRIPELFNFRYYYGTKAKTYGNFLIYAAALNRNSTINRNDKKSLRLAKSRKFTSYNENNRIVIYNINKICIGELLMTSIISEYEDDRLIHVEEEQK